MLVLAVVAEAFAVIRQEDDERSCRRARAISARDQELPTTASDGCDLAVVRVA